MLLKETGDGDHRHQSGLSFQFEHHDRVVTQLG
jgi:hypothetical protein